MSPVPTGSISSYSIDEVTTQDLDQYVGASSGVFEDGRADAALEAEKAAQRAACRVEPYTSALTEALCRRVVRNLAMRNLPLGVQMDEAGGMRIGSVDPEVRRLEAPYRKLVIG